MIRKEVKGESTAVTFILPSERYSVVSVVGDFNEWNPHRHPLVRREDGTMSTTVVLANGAQIHFRYLAEPGTWFDEIDADYIDQFGSVLTV